MDLAAGVELTLADVADLTSKNAVDAREIRQLISEADGPKLDPHGIRIRAAHIEGRVDLENVVTGVGIEFVDCYIPNGLDLRDAKIPKVILSRCVIESKPLEEDRSHDVGDDAAPPTEPPAFDAERLVASVLVINGAHLTSDSSMGVANLRGARIDLVQLDNSEFEGRGGPAIAADGMRSDQAFQMRQDFRASSACPDGAIRILSARIGSQLDLTGADISNSNGPAMMADRLQVDGDLVCRSPFRAAGRGERGAVRLAGAHVGGQFVLGGEIHNESGPALSAEGMVVKQSIFLRDLTAIGDGRGGAVRFVGARAMLFECNGASLTNMAGPALNAPSFSIDQGVAFTNQTELRGDGETGALRLHGAEVGELDLSGATVTNSDGPAFDAIGIKVERDLSLDGLQARGAGSKGVVRLANATVGGRFLVDFDGIEAQKPQEPKVNLDGLTYEGIPSGSLLKDWLATLSSRTVKYAAQPYQQLAAAYRSAGLDAAARKILIAQRKDQLRKKSGIRLPERSWARFTGFALGYGYQPWRALIGLLCAAVCAIVIALTVPDGFVYARTAEDPFKQCGTLDRIGTALDYGLPVIRAASKTYCDFRPDEAGAPATVIMWTSQAMAWAFATLFIVGFTGAVRKT